MAAIIHSREIEMDQVLLRLLADPLRLQIIELLAKEQLCTCHMVEETGASQSNISNHLRALREAGVIAAEPAGRFTYYRLLPDRLMALGNEIDALARLARTSKKFKRPC